MENNNANRIIVLETSMNTAWSAYFAIRDEYTKILDNFIKSNYGDDLNVTFLSETQCTFGFVDGQFSNGMPRYTNIELYIGSTSWDNNDNVFTPDNFKFEVNPFTGGSFPILNTDNNYLRRYFDIIGCVIHKVDTTNKLRDILIEYCNKATEKLNEYINIKNEIKKQKEAEALIAHNEDINARLSTTQWALAIKGDDNNNMWVYRKAPINIIDLFNNYDDVKNALNHINQRQGLRYIIIESSKIKIA